jgi:nitrile hydratase accessory protein
MAVDRKADDTIAGMAGPAALPRKSGEMVFHNEWERRAFAMAVSLSEQGYYDWPQFQQQLINVIAEAEQEDPQNPGRGYYESWLMSLERLLKDKGLLAN